VVAHTLLDTSHLLCCEFSHYGAISPRIFTADQFSGPGKAIGHVRVFVTVLPGIIAMQLCKVPLQRLRDSVIIICTYVIIVIIIIIIINFRIKFVTFGLQIFSYV